MGSCAATASAPFFRRRGFSLVEAVICLVIVGIMVVASLQTLGATARARYVESAVRHGTSLGQDLMGEILATAYEDPDSGGADLSTGREAGEAPDSRASWDDVDDYDGWTATPPQTKEGVELDAFQGWTRSVSVRKVLAGDPGMSVGGATPTGLKRVTVTVTSPIGEETVLTALRSRAGIYDAPGADDRTFPGWVGIELQVGEDAAGRLVSGTALVNRASEDESSPNLLVNPMFENGAASWSGAQCVVTASTASPHTGMAALRVTNRSNFYAGPEQDVTAVLQETVHEASFWVRMETAPANVRIVLYVDSSGSPGYWLMGPATAVGTEWTRVTATLDPSWFGTLQNARVKVRTTDGTGIFLVDDGILRRLN